MMAWTFIVGLTGLSAGLSLIMSVAWLVWRHSGNSGWVDTIWTFGLGFVGLCSAVMASLMGSPTSRAWLVALMAVIWSLRLGLHIALRTRGVADDPRYAKLVREWGADASRRMFWLLQKQALVSIPLAVSMWLAASNPLPPPVMQAVGALVIFITAVAGEAVADEQLRRFRQDQSNSVKVCDTGFWRWSRHPQVALHFLGGYQ